MEPPRKRRRPSDPDVDLNKRRARNDFRLKSIFETIFEKYGRDFDGIGDEIDMRTGEIVVNNGHILGMRNERDAGDVESSGDEFESDCSAENGDREPVAVYEVDQRVIPEPIGVENAACAPESPYSVEDADSLMGDVVGFENPTIDEGEPTEGVSFGQDAEEDELASSEFDWLTPRKVRSTAYDRWHLHELESVDKEAMEPAWRVPPLPKWKPLPRRPPKHAEIACDQVQGNSHSESPGASIWALEESKPRLRRQARARSSPALTHGRTDSATIHDGSASAQQASRTPWTQEEDNLLRHLKTNTQLTAKDMEPYFPLRHKDKIGSHWNNLLNRDESGRRMGTLDEAEQKEFPSSILTSPFLAEDGNDHCHQVNETNYELKHAPVIEEPLGAAAPDLANVLDGLGARIEQAFTYHQGHSNDSAPEVCMKRKHSREEDIADPLRALPTPFSLPAAMQRPHFDQISYSSMQDRHEASRLGSSTPCVQPPFDEAIGMDVDYTTHDVSQQRDSIQPDPHEILSPKASNLPNVEADAALRRSKRIEKPRQGAFTTNSDNHEFHLNEPSDHAIKDEPISSTANQVSTSKPSPEVEAGRDQVLASRKVPSKSQEPTTDPATSLRGLSSPLPAVQPAHNQKLAAAMGNHGKSTSQPKREAICNLSPSKRTFVQVVLPPARSGIVLQRAPLVGCDKDTEDEIQPPCNACQKNKSVRIMDNGENKSCIVCGARGFDRTTEPDFVPTKMARDSTHKDEDPTTNISTQTLEQSPPKISPATVIGVLDSEDELSTPAVHLKNAARRHIGNDKKASNGLEVADSHSTSKVSPQTRTPVMQRKKAARSSDARQLTSELRLQIPRLPTKQKTKIDKAEIADSFESISTAILDDCSEDELSLM